MEYGCDMQILPYCCGMYEAGSFHKTSVNLFRDIKGSTWDLVLDRCFKKAEGRPIVFNFVKEAIYDTDGLDDEGKPTGEFEDDYECETFRQLVKAHKNVIDIGTHINPGTNNKIHTYIIKDYI